MTVERRIEAVKTQLGAVKRDLTSLEALERQARTAAEAARVAHRPEAIVTSTANATATHAVVETTRAMAETLVAELADLEHQADHEAAVLRLADLSLMLARAQSQYDQAVDELPGKLAAILGPARDAHMAWGQLRREALAVFAGAGVRVPTGWEARRTPALLEPVEAVLKAVTAAGGSVAAIRLSRGHFPAVYLSRDMPLASRPDGHPFEAAPGEDMLSRLRPFLVPLLEVSLTSTMPEEVSHD